MSNMIINSEISNLRVVCCNDPTMVSFNAIPDNPVDDVVIDPVSAIKNNLDLMAKTLAQKGTVQESWQTIFQKPDSKQWSDVRVAIKCPCVPGAQPSLAIIDKLCRVFNSLGIAFENIILFDGRDSVDADALFNPFLGNLLPDGIKICGLNNCITSNSADPNFAHNGTIHAPTPRPHFSPTGYKCAKFLADGWCDILVNCVVNSAVGPGTMNATLTMRNNLNVFHAAIDLNLALLELLTAVNKSESIVGGIPVRQQLCVVDSLCACDDFGKIIKNTSPCMIMGTFGPAVDYLTIKKIRVAVLKSTLDPAGENALTRIIAHFGYTREQFEEIDLVSVNN